MPTSTVSNTLALVTGGSRGIGRSIALELAERGHDVIVTYVAQKQDALDVVGRIRAQGRGAAALPLDVGRVEDFGRFVAELRETVAQLSHERVDFLVNNAGVGGYSPFAETSEAGFDELVNVHFKGPFFLTQKLLPLLADGGSIVNLSSAVARYVYPGFSAYAAVKGAVDVLTRALAVELGARRIRINSVAPGGTATDFGGGVLRNPELQRQVAAETPLGRMGEPEDVAGVVAALLGPESRFVTGQRIEVAGGYRL